MLFTKLIASGNIQTFGSDTLSPNLCQTQLLTDVNGALSKIKSSHDTLKTAATASTRNNPKQATGGFSVAKMNAGFSILELVVVMAVMLTVTSIGIPSVNAMMQTYRTNNDVRSIAAQLSLARMRAASESRPARVNFSLAANTFQIELCTSLCNQAGATYVVEGGTQNLSRGVSFGFGSVTAPAGGQTTISQTPQIYFNSRGVSVDSLGNPIGTSAIYITNGQGRVCAVTTSVGGQPTARQYATGTTWKAL